MKEIKNLKKVKVISDLHIYSDYMNSSFFLSDDEMLEKIQSLVESCDLLILNGDVFETYYAFKLPTLNRKIEEIRKTVYSSYTNTFKYIFSNKEKIIFTVGNHDDILCDPLNRKKIFGEDINSLRFEKTLLLEFEYIDTNDEMSIERVLVNHGEEPCYLNQTFFFKFIMPVFWFLATIYVKSKNQVLDSSVEFKVRHRGEIFNEKNVWAIKEYLKFRDINTIVLGHTHKPIITPVTFLVGREEKTYRYVNTGYYNGYINYITTLATGPDSVGFKISQEMEMDESKHPSKSKNKSWFMAPYWVDQFARKIL